GRNVDREHAQELALGVEYLNAPVGAVAYIDVVVAVARDCVGRAELPRTRPLLAPRLHPVAALVDLGDTRVDVAVTDICVAILIPRDVGRLTEQTVDVRQRRLGMPPGAGVLVCRFLAAAEYPLYATSGVELDDHVRALVDRPDIVVAVDAHSVGECPAIEPLADLADELAVLVELQKLRGRGRISGTVGAVRAREHIDVAPGIDRNAGDLAEVHALRQLGIVRHGVEVDLRHALGERRT